MAIWDRERPADGGGRAIGDAGKTVSIFGSGWTGWIGLDWIGLENVRINVLLGILIFAKLQVAATSPSVFLGIKTDAEASAKRFSNVDRTFDSLVSTAAAIAKMGLRAAIMAIEVRARIIVNRDVVEP